MPPSVFQHVYGYLEQGKYCYYKVRLADTSLIYHTYLDLINCLQLL